MLQAVVLTHALALTLLAAELRIVHGEISRQRNPGRNAGECIETILGWCGRSTMEQSQSVLLTMGSGSFHDLG